MFDKAFIAELAKSLGPQVAEAIKPHLGPKIEPTWLNLESAAVYMDTTVDGVRGMLRAKRFPAHKLGERLFIYKRDIDRAMAEGEHWLN